MSKLDEAIKKLENNSTDWLNLDDLDLSNNEDTQRLAHAIGNNKSVVSLQLQGPRLGVEGARYISEALKVNTTLKKMWLFGNGIGSEGTKHISEALKVNTNFNELYLYRNNIGDGGANFIAGVLMDENCKLETLNLEGNDINPKGIMYIADALKFNKTLKVLYLHNNNIGNEGLKYILDALNYNKTLTKLALNGSGIDEDWLSRVEKIIMESSKEQSKATYELLLNQQFSNEQKLYNDAERLFKEEKYSEAAQKYKDATTRLTESLVEQKQENNGDSIDFIKKLTINSYIGLARSCIALEKYEFAKDATNKALEINEFNPEAEKLKLTALVKLAEATEANDDYSDAVDYYSQALKIKLGDKTIKAKRDNVKAKSEILESMKEVTKSLKEVPLTRKQQSDMLKLQKTVKDMVSNSNVVSEQLVEFVKRLKGLEIDNEQFASTLSGLNEELEKIQQDVNPSENNDLDVNMMDKLVYDRELLNHYHLMKDSIALFGFGKAINLSDQLDPHLVSEAIRQDDGDIILAGLTSLDLSEL